MAGDVRPCRILGKGDFRRGRELLDVLAGRMVHARSTHPDFAAGAADAVAVIGGEYAELVRAVREETPERLLDEGLDVAVTALRLVNGEHGNDGKL